MKIGQREGGGAVREIERRSWCQSQQSEGGASKSLLHMTGRANEFSLNAEGGTNNNVPCSV